MEHNYFTSADISENDSWGQLNIVDGGLALCKTCRSLEGGLTTDCPGHVVVSTLEDLVYKGLADYIDGEGWVSKASKHSPAYWHDYLEKQKGGV